MRKIKPNKNRTREVRVPAETISTILEEGGEYELEAGEDFTCSTSTAAQYVREEIRSRIGYVTLSHGKEGNIRVKFVPGRD